MSGLLCLKWNNHSSSLLKKLNVIYSKEVYCDATIACQGKYYPVHRLVLSTCSEYFEEIFERTHCKHPFIIVKDIEPHELEALLSYMYNGEVNVIQETLPGLIKAAETLRIKGLAVSDQCPSDSHDTTPETKKRSNSSISNSHSKRTCRRLGESNDSPSLSQLKNYALESLTSNLLNESASNKRERESSSSVPETQNDIPVSEIKVETFDYPESTEGNSNYDSTSNSNPFAPTDAQPLFSPSMDSSTPLLPESNDNPPSVKPETNSAQCSTWNRNVNQESNSVPLQGEICDAKEERHPRARIRTGNSLDLSGRQEDGPPTVPNDASSSHFSASAPPSEFLDNSSPSLLVIESTHSLHECSYCSFQSGSKQLWQEHCFEAHPGYHLYSCKVCKYQTSTKGLLNRHMLVHNGEKKFKCDYCSYKTAYSFNMKTHAYKHKGIVKKR